MKRVLALAGGDFKNIVRDPVLFIITLIPVFFVLLVRFGLPAARVLLLPYFDLSEHYAFIMSFLIFMTPAMYGTVLGFVLLDERDENILTVISVTPLMKPGYIAYRLLSPAVISFIFSYSVIILSGLVK